VHAPPKTGNQILASLAPADFALLRPDLESIELPLRRQLELRGRRIDRKSTRLNSSHNGQSRMPSSA